MLSPHLTLSEPTFTVITKGLIWEGDEAEVATGTPPWASSTGNQGRGEDTALPCCLLQEHDCLRRGTERQHFSSTDDFYAAIGYGGISLSKILPNAKELYSKQIKQQKIAEMPETVPVIKRSKANGGVIVEGIDNCLIRGVHW